MRVAARNRIIFLREHSLNTGASKTSQPHRCGLTSISVIATGQPLATAIG
jgi:hypothetical protein